MRFQETTFRPLFGRVLAVVIAVLGVIAIASSFITSEFTQALRVVAPTVLVVVLTFAAFWFPHVSIRRDNVEVGNVFSTSVVPWTAIRRIDTKWALALETDAGTVSAWASPAPGRYATLGMAPGDVRGTRSSARAAEGSVRPGDALNTDSGAIAHVIRSHWEELRDDGLLDEPNAGTGARRRVHTRLLAGVGVLVIASALSILL